MCTIYTWTCIYNTCTHENMHICIHVYINIVYIPMYTCLHVYMFTCVHVDRYTYIYSCFHVCRHTCTSVYMDTCVHFYMCTYMHINIYINAHLYTSTFVQRALFAQKRAQYLRVTSVIFHAIYRLLPLTKSPFRLQKEAGWTGEEQSWRRKIRTCRTFPPDFPGMKVLGVLA